MATEKPNFQIRYLEGFKILFQDPNWVNNLLIGSVYLIIPIVGPMVLMGWYCEVVQRLVKRNPHPLPKLDFGDFGYFLGRGVVVFVISLIITIPMVVIVWIIIFIGALLVAVLVGSLNAAHHSSDPFLIIFAVLGFFAIFVAILFPFTVFVNAAMTRAYLTEDFGKALNFGKIFGYAKATWKKVMLAYLIYLPITFGIMIVGALALYLGMYPAMMIINLAWVYLAWQIYESYGAEGGETIEMPANPKPIPSEQKQAAVPT